MDERKMAQMRLALGLRPKPTMDEMLVRLGLRWLQRPLSAVEKRTGERPFRVISNGLGRDSATMIALLLEGKLRSNGRRIGPDDVDVVVFSDTGYEWGFSYDVIGELSTLLAARNVPFFVLQKPPENNWVDGVNIGWRPFVEQKQANFERAWEATGGVAGGTRWRALLGKVTPPWVNQQWTSIADKAAGGGYHMRAPLMEEFSAYRRLNMRASAECTVAHKIDPIKRFIQDLIQAKYGVKLARGVDSWQNQVQRGERDPIEVIIGFAADEEERAQRSKRALSGKQGWKIEVYPLIEMGITKDHEVAILERHGLNWIRKSGCMFCHFQGLDWFWALSVLNPAMFDSVAAYEARALTRNPKWWLREERPIREGVARWRLQNPNATIDEVLDKAYKRCGPQTADGLPT